jgi:hypothetical protein
LSVYFGTRANNGVRRARETSREKMVMQEQAM